MSQHLLASHIAVISHSTAPFAYVNEQYTIVFANRALLELTRFSAEDLVDLPLSNLLLTSKKVLTGEPAEMFCHTASGKQIPVWVGASAPIHLEENIFYSLSIQPVIPLTLNVCHLAERDTLLNNIPNMIWSIDRNFRLLSANESFLYFLKTRTGKEFAFGENLYDHPFTRFFIDRWMSEIRQVFLGHKVRTLKHLNATEHYDESWVEVSANPIFNESNWVTGLACYLSDRTKGTKKQQNLAESRQNLALAQKLVKLGNWSVNLVDSKFSCSDQMLQIFDLKAATARQNLFWFLRRVHKQDRDRLVCAIKKSFIQRNEYRIHYRILTLTGKVRHIEQVAFHEQKDGKVVRVFGTVQDITNHVLAQKQLEFSNERYELVARFSKLTVWDWDLKTNRIVRAGNSFNENFGYKGNATISPDELLDLLPPNDRNRVQQKYISSLQDPQITQIEVTYRLRKANGEYAHVNSRAGILRNAIGQAYRLVGVLQDITREREHVHEMKRLQTNTKALINNTQEPIWSMDHELRLITGNKFFLQQYYRATGQKIAEGKPVLQSFPQDIKDLWTGLYKRALAGEAHTYHDVQHDEEGNLIKHNCVYFTPIYSKTGKITGVACYSKNLFELSAMTAKLKESENLFNSLFELSPQPIVVYDCEANRFKLVNKAAKKLFGYTRDEFLNLALIDLGFPGFLRDGMIDFKKELHESTPFNDTGIIKTRTKSGALLYVKINHKRIDIKTKLHILITVEDVTAKLRTEKVINRAILKAQESERYQIGSELHDNICQLLASSKMRISLAEKDTIPGNRELLQQSREYLIKALNEIRSLSHRLAPSFFNDKTLDCAFEELFVALDLEGNYQLFTYFDKEIHSLTLSKELKLNLYRILQEQLLNIKKHAHATIIEVDLVTHKNTLKMRIADDGAGFQPAKVTGGIGLNNMQRRVEMYDGHMALMSKPGHGTEINITIPISPHFKRREVIHTKWDGAY